MKSTSITQLQARGNQSGAVSIFIVIFAALLLSIITISFVRLMIADQQRATNEDLSQSAYDSATTGVEDAKRALLNYQRKCQTGGPEICADARKALIAEEKCNAGLRVDNVIGAADLGDTSSGEIGEVKIQQNIGDKVLDQAYTCVIVGLETPDYLGEIAQNETKLIPLSAVNNDTSSSDSFNKVTIEWFSSKDLGEDETAIDLLSQAASSSSQPLTAQSAWPGNRPPLLRTGLMQVGGGFTTNDFDATVGDNSNANTLFLYPVSSVGTPSTAFVARDVREPIGETKPAGADATLPTHCEDEISGDAGNYSCKIILDLPTPINGGLRTAYLRLTSLYNAAHFRITLSNDEGVVNFSDVQANVDSTGRANDLFRRVVSRVDLVDTTFPYPEGAVDVSGNLCKEFAVTDTLYLPGAGCTP
jgi:hypothetical protein